jgi:hypothetical protein
MHGGTCMRRPDLLALVEPQQSTLSFSFGNVWDNGVAKLDIYKPDPNRQLWILRGTDGGTNHVEQHGSLRKHTRINKRLLVVGVFIRVGVCIRPLPDDPILPYISCFKAFF